MAARLSSAIMISVQTMSCWQLLQRNSMSHQKSTRTLTLSLASLAASVISTSICLHCLTKVKTFSRSISTSSACLVTCRKSNMPGKMSHATKQGRSARKRCAVPNPTFPFMVCVCCVIYSNTCLRQRYPWWAMVLISSTYCAVPSFSRKTRVGSQNHVNIDTLW